MQIESRRSASLPFALVACVLAAAVARADAPVDAGPPVWAYPGNVPGAAQPPQDADEKLRVPDSTVSFARKELRNLFAVPDWYPGDHPAMPDVVVHGRAPGVRACGFCHLPSGDGRPENAPLAGLPESYIVQQMADFKSGARTSSVPHRLPTDWMAEIGKVTTDGEVRSAAAYFARLPLRSHLSVIETPTVPRTVAKGWLLTPVPDGGTEPLGDRIVETPADLERFEQRDAHVPILAYVPPGSIARGKALANGDDTRGIPACAACHGDDLGGTDAIPSLAGKSPSYVVRQLYDFRSGARSGPSAEPMKPVVAPMSQADMLNLAAYLASLKPKPAKP
ncbi:MAG: c-type cytochrome [Sphingomonas sp.]|jgi:cytochrome c553|uniref:c-type cytochrome n=1 Tax=Sphingomonas sp. TaxID=28214 RepID=UPI003567D975